MRSPGATARLRRGMPQAVRVVRYWVQSAHRRPGGRGMTGDVHDRHDRQLILTTPTRPTLRSQRLRLINHQGDALRLGMNWTESCS